MYVRQVRRTTELIGAGRVLPVLLPFYAVYALLVALLSGEPLHRLWGAWACAGYTAAALIAAVVASLVLRPPATSTAAAIRLALGLALMFAFAPATRWGYFVLSGRPVCLGLAGPAVRPGPRPAGPSAGRGLAGRG
jgi:hypothetical protein